MISILGIAITFYMGTLVGARLANKKWRKMERKRDEADVRYYQEYFDQLRKAGITNVQEKNYSSPGNSSPGNPDYYRGSAYRVSTEPIGNPRYPFSAGR